jgi:hypothetical protein
MAIFSQLKDNLPMLHNLEIRYLNKSLSQPVDYFKNAPNLRRVMLDGLSPSTDMKLPLAQLTHFSNGSLLGGTSVEFLTLLELTPVLQEVDWSIPGMQDPQFHSSPSLIIQHLSLRFLYICIKHDPGNLFDRLSLPSLHSLTIIQQGPWPCLPLGRFFSRCPSLEHLDLDTVGLECFPHSELVAQLKPLSSLSHLTFANSNSMARNFALGITTKWTPIDQLLQSLHYNASEKYDMEPVLLPRLVFLLINCDDSISPIDRFLGKFVDMVKSQWRIPVSPSEACAELTDQSRISRLGAARLVFRVPNFDITVDPTAIERLRNLKSEGLKIQLSRYNIQLL